VISLHSILFDLGGTVCHQIADRSFFVEGVQLPLCIRCSAIHFSLWYAFATTLICSGSWINHVSQSTVRIILIGSLAPVAIDIAWQIWGNFLGDNDLRFFTGLLAGVGIGLFMAKTIASLKQEGSTYAAPMSSIRLTLAVVLFFPIVFAFWQGNSSLLTVMQYYQGLSVVMVFTVLWGLFYGFFRSSFGHPFPKFSNWTSIGLSFSIIQAIIFLQIR